MNDFLSKVSWTLDQILNLINRKGRENSFSLSSAVRPDLAKFHHFGKILKLLDNFLRV